MQTLIPWWWKYGGPRDIWIRYEDLIKRVIDKFRIKAVSEATLENMRAGGVIVDSSLIGGGLPAAGLGTSTFLMMSPMTASASKAVRPKFPPFPGGIKGPHMHYNGQVYMLSAEQWRAFSDGLRSELVNRLKDAKSITLQQAIDLTETIDGLG